MKQAFRDWVIVMLGMLGAALILMWLGPRAFGQGADFDRIRVTGTSGEAVGTAPVGSDPSAAEVISWATAISEAIASGNYVLALAPVLMLLVFVVRVFFLKQIPKAFVPWVTVGLSVALATGTSLYAGKDITGALGDAVITGLAAVGAWEMGGKKVKGMTKKKVVGEV